MKQIPEGRVACSVCNGDGGYNVPKKTGRLITPPGSHHDGGRKVDEYEDKWHTCHACHGQGYK